MTAYTPQTQVLINGVDYASKVEYSIKTNTGRNSITEQPQAGHTSVNLYTDWNTVLPINLNDEVEIKINKTTGVYTHIFSGMVSDISIRLAQKGNAGNQVIYALTVVDALAGLSRKTVGAAGFAKEFDGTRVYNILTEAYLTNWSEVSPTVTWANTPELVTWATYDGVNNDLVNALATQIDTPGQYELEAYSSGLAQADTLLEQAANSGRGVLYAKGDGSLMYDDYLSRGSATQITLTGSHIMADGLAFDMTLGEIVNDVEVTYRAGSEFARDEQSAVMYGQLAGTRETVLHNQTSAQAQAASFLASRAYPRKYPKELTVTLANPALDDTTRNKLIDATVSTRITTSALPPVFGSTFDGFIESYSWELTKGMATLIMSCSAYTENYPYTIWLQVAPSYNWTTYGTANPTQNWTQVT